jgi:thiol-disulfide isomerase/thioredoxin
MKNLFLSALVLSLTFCSQPKNYQDPNSQIAVSTLSGQIENYDDSLPQTISTLIFDIAEGKQKSNVTEIDKTGKFTFKINLYLPQDFYIQYNDQLVEILMEPGDSLFIRFNSDDICKTVSFLYDHSDINRQVRDFLNIFGDFWDKTGDVTSQARKVRPMEYKKLVLKQQEKYDSIASNFLQTTKTIKEAETWIRTYVRYKCGNDVLQIFFNPEIIVPDEYWDFVYKYPPENNDFFFCSEYRLFLSTFNSNYFFKTKRLESALKAYREKNYTEYLKIFTDSISRKYSGISRDALITQACFSVLQKDSKVVDSLLYNGSIKINSVLLLGQLKNEIQLFKEQTENQKSGISFLNTKTNNNKGQLLANLIREKYKDKVVYVDFWATWCSPCLQEFPYSKTLHEKLAQKGIVFLYVCSDSEENAWKKIINQFDLRGEHILLENDQFSYIRAEYQIPGFPTYLIFDKNGNLTNKNAPRPSSKEIESILTGQLNK